MRKKEKLFHSTNKKTVASLGLLSYDADGTLVLNEVYVKAYEISKNIMKNIHTKDNKEKIRFIYLSSDGICCQLFMVVYFESIDDVERFESQYSLTGIKFNVLINLILSIRDQDKEFSLNEYERKKYDLGKYIEQIEYEDKFKAIEFLKHPIQCQSELFSFLKKMELPYIFVVEKQDIEKEDLENILRQMERKYNMKPSVDKEFAFGYLSLIVFSQDEETLDIGLDSLKRMLTNEGFVVDIGTLNDKQAYEYHTSLGIFSKNLNSLMSKKVLEAFL